MNNSSHAAQEIMQHLHALYARKYLLLVILECIQTHKEKKGIENALLVENQLVE
jgi:hypothetical protein